MLFPSLLAKFILSIQIQRICFSIQFLTDATLAYTPGNPGLPHS